MLFSFNVVQPGIATPPAVCELTQASSPESTNNTLGPDFAAQNGLSLLRTPKSILDYRVSIAQGGLLDWRWLEVNANFLEVKLRNGQFRVHFRQLNWQAQSAPNSA